MKYSYLYGAEGSPVNYSLDTYRDKTRFVLAAFLATVAVFGIVASQLVNIRTNTVQASPDTTRQQQAAAPQQPTPDTPATQAVTTKPVDVKDVSSSIDLSAWLMSHKGTYSISIYDMDGKSLSDVNSNEHYFMASIYKLYVAYVAYQHIDSGVWNADEPFLKDWSRGKCLDEMIRNSDSPCGEKMMAEIGKTNVQDKLDEYGLENTSFKTFETSSADVANILVRLQKGVDLSQASKEKLMDSMLGQKYREGLPAGFGDWATYDKVGFREQTEYHDVAIVMTPSGKSYVVSVLTRDAGSANIASLAQTIRASIK